MAAKDSQRRFSKLRGSIESAPRPLADRLRPQKLAEVVGQDRLVMARIGRWPTARLGHLGSLIFVGHPAPADPVGAAARR